MGEFQVCGFAGWKMVLPSSCSLVFYIALYIFFSLMVVVFLIQAAIIINSQKKSQEC